MRFCGLCFGTGLVRVGGLLMWCPACDNPHASAPTAEDTLAQMNATPEVSQEAYDESATPGEDEDEW